MAIVHIWRTEDSTLPFHMMIVCMTVKTEMDYCFWIYYHLEMWIQFLGSLNSPF